MLRQFAVQISEKIQSGFSCFSRQGEDWALEAAPRQASKCIINLVWWSCAQRLAKMFESARHLCAVLAPKARTLTI